ncbi:hypothetical protein [Mangrovimonas cancribranchiae]|uniref:Uncharacterized protein n=1 Tax=Mangrovimonas cancribranchiae TaxID=3080055 RepID=A0AAU6P675_9FLAO
MKNLKRIILLAVLAFLAGKLLFSDFDFGNHSENETITANILDE